MDYRKVYEKWLVEVKNEEMISELKNMSEKEIEDSFYKDLSFGTGGLRGTIIFLLVLVLRQNRLMRIKRLKKY